MVEFILNGQRIDSPNGWQEIAVNASFESGVQPNITTDDFEFGSDAIAIIDNWISNHGIGRGCPLVISEDGVIVFDGYLDFLKRFTKVHKGKYIVAVQKSKGLNELIEGIDGYTFALLQKKTPLSFSNIPYIVEKKDNGVERVILILTTLILLKESYESIRRIAKAVKELVMAVANPVTSPERLIGVALQLVIDILYTVSIMRALKDAITKLVDNFFAPIRYHKGINVNTALNSFFTTLGYNGYDTSINELKSLYYFPSKEEDVKSTGIPNPSDNGYLMSEFITILKDAFKAKLVVDSSNKVQFRNEEDVYFVRNSTYVMPDIDLESTEYNTSELKGTKTIAFETDVNDEWTIANFKGTAYDIYTRTSSSVGTNLVKGVEQVKLGVCLGHRKTRLTDFESDLKTLASLADGVLGILGGSSNLSSKITNRIGYLKVSQNNWSKPKMLYLDGSLKIPTSNRALWSAKSLYDNYHSKSSFVLNGNLGQKAVFKGIEIPFCLTDFSALIDNSYFRTNSNKIGKFTDVKYILNDKKAVVDFWIREVYDKNLIEEYVEP